MVARGGAIGQDVFRESRVSTLYILQILGVLAMNGTYTAIIKKDGDWWIGWIEEIPGVNC
ncbi:hypothetical protein [Baaleninema sp.]|uniref:hypothetical protein n=1 Tax=Baaleninema sp. TaxID=3101197 RepID=UPI003CFEDEB1